MKVALRAIRGPWDAGWVLDKHMVKSVYLGDDEHGRPQFDNTRTEVGEATYQMKYRGAWDQAPLLARAVFDHIYPKLDHVGLIVPMPASTPRQRQPVTEVARELAKLVVPDTFENLLLKKPNGKSLKDLKFKEEKEEAIGDSFYLNDQIQGDGPWNVLVIDDLYDTGATMEAACKTLRTYRKVGKIYVAALTWK